MTRYDTLYKLLVVGDAAEEVLQLVVGHVARPDERPPELDHGPHDHQKPAKERLVTCGFVAMTYVFFSACAQVLRSHQKLKA